MKALRIISIILLIFNAVSGLAGGIALFTDPAGYSIQMPLSLLEHSPFENFLVPGILLFVFNGFLSLVAAVAVIRKYTFYHLLICLQGLVSITWIVTQVIMIQAVGFLHYLYGSIGIILLLIGIALSGFSKKKLR